MGRTRIVIADDHAVLREALNALFQSQPELEIVGQAGTADQTLIEAVACQPDLILLDISLPDRSGISLIPELRERCPNSRIVVLTMHEDAGYLRSAFAAGASGYVCKSSGSVTLFEAIRTVAEGSSFIDPVLRTSAGEMNGPRLSQAPAPIARLSERERQVLLALAQGWKYQTIAERMGISVKTVETYRSRLTAKLGFQNRADLMRFSIESGILAQMPVSNN